MALEPALEIGEADFGPDWHLDALEQLAVAQEFHLLAIILVTMRAIEPARRLSEIGRLGDVEHPPAGLAQFGQCDRGLAGPRRPQHDHRRRPQSYCFLDVIEHDRLVEQDKLIAGRMEPSQSGGSSAWGGRIGRQHVGGGAIRCQLDLVGIDPRAAQEARLLIGMVVDNLEKQTDDLAAVTDELHKQPALVIELCPPVRRGRQLLDRGSPKVSVRDRRPDPAHGLLQALGAEPLIGEDSHGTAHIQSGIERAIAKLRSFRLQFPPKARAPALFMGSEGVSAASCGTPRMQTS